MYYTNYRQAAEVAELVKEEYGMTLEELFYGRQPPAPVALRPRYQPSSADTLTFKFDRIPTRISSKYDLYGLLNVIKEFNEKHKGKFDGDKKQYYRSFTIPKATGHGRRQIDAPTDELKAALYDLKDILENDFGLLYHTSAFAYMKGRCPLDAVKRHQSNQSRWFLKLDFSNFFGSTTKEFVMRQFEQIYPIGEIMRWSEGKEEVSKALDLAFLNGGLPQGTPISPMLTNIIMIPIDRQIALTVNKMTPYMVYTRYADDMLISSQYDFKPKDVEDIVINILKEHQAPFILKSEKTRFGSNAGRNWNLGVMLNKDNVITIGYRKKEQLKAMLNNFTRDYTSGNPWELGEVQHLAGLISYYLGIEKQAIEKIISSYGKKYNTDIMKDMKQIIAGQ